MESLQLLIQVHTELSDIEAKVKKMKQIISTHLERLHSKSNNQDLMSVSPLEGEKQKKKKKHQDQASTSAFSQQRDIYENRETIDAFAPPIRFPPKPQKQREEEEEAEEHVYAEF
ncbi:hypothetical protein M3Y99_01424600 [Aphelenchoides fujianensis]|nr:hypothetical protein M3Y99_01424600 [Aphelenchoides fujianensis]